MIFTSKFNKYVRILKVSVIIMKLKIFLLCSYFPFILTQNNVILLQNCTKSALKSFENANGNVAHVIYNDGNIHRNFITGILQGMHQTVMISDKVLDFFNDLYRLIPSGYLIIASSKENLKKILGNLNISNPNWYPRLRFVVVMIKTIDVKKESIISEEISQIMYSFDATDILILLKNNNSVNAYTWFPYSAKNKCASQFHTTLLDRCTFKIPYFMKNLYPSKIPKKFRGCPLRFSGFNWPPYVFQDNVTKEFTAGYNIIAVEELAKRHNLTLIGISPDEGTRWGFLLKNGTWIGGLGHLQSNKADLSLGGSLQTTVRINIFDFSPTLNSIYMTFYLPLPSKLPHWKNMIDIFSFEFWVTVWAIYLITSFVICFVSKLNRRIEKKFYNNLSNCFLTLWRIAVGNSACCIPNSQAVRIIFVLWVIYNFHITLVYTSSLLSFITKPAYETPMRTLKELSDSNLKITAVEQFMQVSNMMDEEYKAILARKFNPYTDYKKDINQMLSKKKFVILDTADHFEIFAKDEVSKLYSLDDAVRLNPCIYLRKGSIFLKFVDKIQYDLKENGLLEKAGRDYTEIHKYGKTSTHNYHHEVLPLMLRELSGSFYVLLFGLVLSTVIFVAEVIFHWYL